MGHLLPFCFVFSSLLTKLHILKTYMQALPKGANHDGEKPTIGPTQMAEWYVPSKHGLTMIELTDLRLLLNCQETQQSAARGWKAPSSLSKVEGSHTLLLVETRWRIQPAKAAFPTGRKVTVTLMALGGRLATTGSFWQLGPTSPKYDEGGLSVFLPMLAKWQAALLTYQCSSWEHFPMERKRNPNTAKPTTKKSK